MPTNRPFFTNFLAAFRAHSALQKSTTLTVSPAGTSSQTTHTNSTTNSHSSNASNPRSIATKATQQSFGATAAAVQAAGHLQSTRQHSTSPVSRSPMSPTSPPGGMMNRSRRGSDSSSEGFRDTLGAEKWYIGGRSAAGEERYYRLGVVRRHRSVDRLSLDRLSL
ncbi:MAG: hypothetical protein M1812_002989 [Candelaria pacifica]|nr:MAG: hypothetical protein M1812_002989 [Candelaria pacifica]